MKSARGKGIFIALVEILDKMSTLQAMSSNLKVLERERELYDDYKYFEIGQADMTIMLWTGWNILEF